MGPSRPPWSGRPLDQLLVLFQARALVLGGREDVLQSGRVDVEPRQGVARFHEKPVLLRRVDPGVRPPFQHAVSRVGHGAGGRQPVALSEVDGAVGRQQVPKIVVAPARPRKTVVDVRSVSNSRIGPDAGERESVIAQLLCPFLGDAGVVAAFGPFVGVVRCQIGPGFPHQGRLAGGLAGGLDGELACR